MTAVSLSARREVRLRVSRYRPLPRWVLPSSLALHLIVLLLLVMVHPRPPAEPTMPSPVAMVFLPPKHGARSAPRPSKYAIPARPQVATIAPLPAPLAPAAMPKAQPAPLPPAPAAKPKVQPAPLPPAPAAKPKAQPAPLPPAPAAKPKAQPAPLPPAPAAKPKAQPAPLPPAPAAKPKAQPAPLPPPAPPTPKTGTHQMLALTVPLRVPSPSARALPPAHHPTAFPTPTQFSLGHPAMASVSRAQPSTYGPAARGPLSFGRFARVTGGHVDPSWLDELHAWWERHSYYPPEAVANGQDGTVGIQIVVDRWGHVQSVQQETQSGSSWLDMAAVGTFRGANLPPLPPGTTDKTITVDLNITYVLLR